MRKPNPKRYVVWFAKAKEDLRYAQGNLEMGFFSQVCFLRQQAAEEALQLATEIVKFVKRKIDF